MFLYDDHGGTTRRDRQVLAQRCRDAEMQRCRDAEMQRCRDAEMQRCGIGNPFHAINRAAWKEADLAWIE
jgi:hypothetical protein